MPNDHPDVSSIENHGFEKRNELNVHLKQLIESASPARHDKTAQQSAKAGGESNVA